MLETRSQLLVIAQQMLCPRSQFLIPGSHLLVKFIGGEQQSGNSAGKGLVVKQEDLVQPQDSRGRKELSPSRCSLKTWAVTYTHMCVPMHTSRHGI